MADSDHKMPKSRCPVCHGLGEVWAYPGVAASCTNPECRDGFILKAIETGK